MTQKELCEIFENIEQYMGTNEFKEDAIEKIKEYINKNFVDVADVFLGDKNIYILPKEDKPIGIIYK
jgi:hypothetical protein